MHESKCKVRAWLWGCLLACVSVLGVTSPRVADAAVFRATWDPLYGAPFTGVGWRGTVDFVVPGVPGCDTDGTACVAGSFLTNANVTFYNDSNANPFAEINWNQADLSGVSINALSFGGGTIPTQLATSLFPNLSPTQVAVDPLFASIKNVDFALQFFIEDTLPGDDFVFSGPALRWSRCGECRDDCGSGDDDHDEGGHRKKHKRHGDDRDGRGHPHHGEEETECTSGWNDVQAHPPTNFTITQVPEPASGALVGLALVAAGVTVRRTRRSQAARSV